MTHQDALTLQLLDWPLLLVRSIDTKAPVQTSWPTIKLEAEDIESAVASHPEYGFAVKLGGPTAFIDIEGDGPTAGMDWAILTDGLDIPDTCGWTSPRGVHRMFTLSEEQRERIGTGVVKVNDLEIRLGAGDKYTHYSIVPPYGQREWISESRNVVPLPDELAERICQLTQANLSPFNANFEPEQPDAPGSIFNQMEDWDSLLIPDGWKKIGSRQDGVDDWCRPGKSEGLSATTGFCGDRLYVFTTNAEGLESGVSYDKFQYWTFTKCDGDFHQAATDLARNGYNKHSVDVEPTSPAELFDDLPPEIDIVEEVPESESDLHPPLDLLMFPGFVSEFAKFHAKSAFVSDLRAGAVGGILLQSWLMSRRVRLVDGTRPNLAMLMLGTSGSGKTAVAKSIQKLLCEINSPHSLLEEVKSGEGLEDTVAITPNLIYVQEEAQDIMLAMGDHQENLRSRLASKMKRLYTASSGMYYCRVGAGDERPTIIDQPALSMMFTAIPHQLWNSITEKILVDGFFGRFLVLELLTAAELNRNPTDDKQALINLKDHCREWWSIQPEELDPLEGLDTQEVSTSQIEPAVVGLTPDAEELAWQYRKQCFELAGDGSNMVQQAMWSRSHEMVCRLALCMCGSAGARDLTVTADMVERAIEIVACTNRLKTYRMAHVKPRETVQSKLCESIVHSLHRSASKGKTKIGWSNMLKNMNQPSWQFRKAMVDLVLRGEVYTNAPLRPDGSDFAQLKGKMFLCLPKHAQEHLATTSKT